MSIEQTDGHARWVYRVDPAKPREVQRKRNLPRARWVTWARYATAAEARAAVLGARARPAGATD